MKILKKHIDKTGAGSLELFPASDEDFWFLYNLIEKGDFVTTKTSRKIKKESRNGSLHSEKVSIILTLKVINIDYCYDEGTETVGLCIKGKCTEQNQYIPSGQVISIQLEVNNPLCLTKSCWNKSHYKLLEEIGPEKSTDMGLLIIEETVSLLYKITSSGQAIKFRVDKSIPKKFHSILEAILKEIDLDQIQGLVIASPSSLNSDFNKYLVQASEKPEYKVLRNNKQKITLITSKPFKGSLKDILKEPCIADKFSNVKDYKQLENMLSRFDKLLLHDAHRVAYGEKYVREAQNQGAIKDLFILDCFVKTKDFSRRKMYNDLVEEVKRNGGGVHVIQKDNPLGSKLNDYTGIAAILHFPVDMEYLEEKPMNEIQIPAIQTAGN